LHLLSGRGSGSCCEARLSLQGGDALVLDVFLGLDVGDGTAAQFEDALLQ